jgi:hypothetical protein
MSIEIHPPINQLFVTKLQIFSAIYSNGKTGEMKVLTYIAMKASRPLFQPYLLPSNGGESVLSPC